jgi:hypothetical protein
MTRYATVLLLAGTILAGCNRPQPEITQENVQRVLTTLASDDMRGRDAFSDDAMRAARFISDEFAAIGLDMFEPGDDYLQRIPIYSVATSAVTVTLDGQTIAGERVAASIASESVEWTRDAGPEIMYVPADGNVIESWQGVRRAGGDVLMVVHPEQSETFERLMNFVNRPSRTMDMSAGTNLVMVLADISDVQEYSVQVTAAISETLLANVVGVLPGRRSDEIVVFGGHYDHIGIVRPVDGDSIGNGANDDASGTAAVVELARYYKGLGKPERTIQFVAFTAEESGGYGSRHYSGQLDPDQIVAMFNIEMIGKGAVEGPNTAWITGFERSTFGEILQRAVEGTEYEFYADPYPDQNLFFRSDNATLARLGVPAHSISTTPIDVDPDYHAVTDEVETLDMVHLTNTIRAIAQGATTIISGEETPTRIDPDTL